MMQFREEQDPLISLLEEQNAFEQDSTASRRSARRSMTMQNNDDSSPTTSNSHQAASEDESVCQPAKKRGRKPAPDAAEKRKVQNRRAQKTFRERKKNRVKHLEEFSRTLRTGVDAAFLIMDTLVQENNVLIQRQGGTRPPISLEKLLQGTPLAELYSQQTASTAEVASCNNGDFDFKSTSELLAPYTPNLASADMSSVASQTNFSSRQSLDSGATSPAVDAAPAIWPNLCADDALDALSLPLLQGSSVANFPNTFPAAPFSFPLGLQLQGEGLWPTETASAFKWDPTLVPTPNGAQVDSMSWLETTSSAAF